MASSGVNGCLDTEEAVEPLERDKSEAKWFVGREGVNYEVFAVLLIRNATLFTQTFDTDRLG